MRDTIVAAVEALLTDASVLDGLIAVLVEDKRLANVASSAASIPKKFVSQAEREDRIHSAQLLALAYGAKKALARRTRAQRFLGK